MDRSSPYLSQGCIVRLESLMHLFLNGLGVIDNLLALRLPFAPTDIHVLVALADHSLIFSNHFLTLLHFCVIKCLCPDELICCILDSSPLLNINVSSRSCVNKISDTTK